jgi:IclR family transcriptional regulator, KDG regulon repressor
MQEENMKSLVKTFDILEIFLHGPEEISVTDISKTLGLNKTTVSRIMLKLTNRGYLRQVEVRGKYTLGTIFLEYSGILKSRMKIRDIAVPFLIELSRKVKESTMLAVWDTRNTTSVITESFHDTAYLNSPLRVVPDEGISMPFYCTCLGKIFLASKSKTELQAYLKSNKLERLTPNTIVDIEEISKQILEIKRTGVSYDNEEYHLGVRGVAVPLFNNEEITVGSISIVAPSVRMSPSSIQGFVPLLEGYASEISRQLGYRAHGNSPIT